MFSYIHLADTARLTGLGYPLPYIFLAIPILYFFTMPTVCLFQPAGSLLTSNKLPATSGDPRFDPRFFVGLLAGTFVLSQSTVVDMLYTSAGLLHSALAHRPL